MNTLRIGNIPCSKVILGTAYFTPAVQETAEAVMDAYYARGGRSIDTARVYGGWDPAGIGASEAVVGAWLSSRGYRDITLITKGAHPTVGDMHDARLNRDAILSDAESSVRALGRVPDIWFLHRDDLSREIADIAASLKAVVSHGFARTVGASNWTFDRILAYNAYAAAHDCPMLTVSQIQWSLARTTPALYGDDTLICMNDTEYVKYLTHQFPVFAFSSQAKGFFSKAIADGVEKLPSKAKTRFVSPENLRKLEIIRKRAQESGKTPAALTLSYITANPVPACAIAAFSSVAQLEDSLA